MPTLDDLGQRIKQKYPGQYDDLSNADLAQRVKTKFPGAYDDFTGTAPPVLTMGGPSPLDPGLLGRLGAGKRDAAGKLIVPQPGAGPTLGATIATISGAGIPLTAAAAGAGEALDEWMHGDAVNPLKIGKEAAWMAALGGVEKGAKMLGTQILRTLPGGVRIRFDEAATKARQLAADVFQPQTRESIGEMFDLVRQSGVKVDTKGVQNEVLRLNEGKYADLLGEVQRIDNAYKTGGRYTTLLESLRGKLPTQAGYDIGDLQQLRSAVGQRVQQLEPVEAKQLLRDLQGAIDETIDTGLARGRVPVGAEPQILRQARQEWARMRAAEDMGQMVEKAITSTPDLAMNSFNLRKFADELRRGTSDISQSVTRGLDRTPGAKERLMASLEDLSKQFQTIELPLADVTGFRRNAIVAGLGQLLSGVLLTEPGQRLFRQAIVSGDGAVGPNALALIANAARRGGAVPTDVPRSGVAVTPGPATP